MLNSNQNTWPWSKNVQTLKEQNKWTTLIFKFSLLSALAECNPLFYFYCWIIARSWPRSRMMESDGWGRWWNERAQKILKALELLRIDSHSQQLDEHRPPGVMVIPIFFIDEKDRDYNNKSYKEIKLSCKSVKF